VKIRQLLEAKCSGRTPVFGRRKSANLISLLAFTDGMKSSAEELLLTLVWLGSYTYWRFIGSRSLSHYNWKPWKVNVLYVLYYFAFCLMYWKKIACCEL
jgi:hypothetical protein